MKGFLNSVWYALIAYGLILVGAVVAVYHLISYPAVIGTIAGFVITGFVLLAVRKFAGEK